MLHPSSHFLVVRVARSVVHDWDPQEEFSSENEAERRLRFLLSVTLACEDHGSLTVVRRIAQRPTVIERRWAPCVFLQRCSFGE
ncbi:hypothetical protein COCON_G00194640 [Conger conger]|uniref:Uncharacterized protein n=1 Tax=Conger conger TaxID=82655 RepID=A0A9Q1D0Z8_CONCO|nr:hypothetical protein COCON_G00194640 [Conger conger]